MTPDKQEETNEHGHIKTPFDNKKALIVGDHPHSSEVAICLGADRLKITGGFGLYFKGEHRDFYVMEPKHIKWI